MFLQCLSIKKLFQNNKDWGFFLKNLRGRRKNGCLWKGLAPPPTIETRLFTQKKHITLQFKTDTRYIVYVSLIMSLSNYNLTDEIMDSNNKKDYLILTVTKD